MIRSNESKEERNEWGRERSFKDRKVEERRRTEGGEGAYNKNSRERLIQLGCYIKNIKRRTDKGFFKKRVSLFEV